MNYRPIKIRPRTRHVVTTSRSLSGASPVSSLRLARSVSVNGVMRGLLNVQAIHTRSIRVRRRAICLFLNGRANASRFFKGFVRSYHRAILRVRKNSVQVNSCLGVSHHRQRAIIHAGNHRVNRSKRAVSDAFRKDHRDFDRRVNVNSHVANHRHGKEQGGVKGLNGQRENGDRRARGGGRGEGSAKRGQTSSRCFGRATCLLFSASSSGSGYLQAISTSAVSNMVAVPSLAY